MSSPDSSGTETASSTGSGRAGSLLQEQQIFPRNLSGGHRNSGPIPQYQERRPSSTAFPSRHHRSSLSNALNNELPPLPTSEPSLEWQRQRLIARDRKRRLTGSAYETGRRRTTTGAFMNREDGHHDGSAASSIRPHSQSFNNATNNAHSNEVIDLTNSQPSASVRDTRPRHNTNSSESSRLYVVPRWQPDSEVSECPLCHRPFGLLFRRHHCRKCGRVVCNDCSPHRITIPRQFIVHPPGFEPESPSRLHHETVDLTEDDDENTPVMFLGTQRTINPAFGGGEKVRLCNPCVPDPQPEPQLHYGGPSGRPFPHFSGGHTRLSSMPNQPSLSNIPFYPSGSFQSRALPGTRLYPPPPHPGTRIRLAEEDGNEPESSTEIYSSATRQYVPTYTPHSRYPGYNTSHSRHHSVDVSRPHPAVPQPPHLYGNRPRVHSMLDPHAQHLTFSPGMTPPALQHASLPSLSARPSRPRVNDEDLCPICRGLLPPKGPTGDETSRENHIMQCITVHDASTSGQSRERSTSQSLSQSPFLTSNSEAPTSSSFAQRMPAQLLRFTATEKDCVGEDGNLQECSICMVEYDVGDRLARLECWCKFHDECIVEWFGRKRECPVHKVA